MYNRVSFTLRPRRFHLFSMSAVLSPHIIYRHIMCMCFPTNGEVCVCAAAYVRRHDCGLLCCWSSLCETASTRFAVCNAMQTSFQCRMQLSQTGGVCCNYQATARSFFLFTSSRRDAFKCNSQVATTARRARCLSAQQLINAHTSCTGLFVSKYRMLAGACGSVQKNAPGKINKFSACVCRRERVFWKRSSDRLSAPQEMRYKIWYNFVCEFRLKAELKAAIWDKRGYFLWRVEWKL